MAWQKKYEKSIFSMGNLEQISISVYPLKKLLQVPLNISGFYQKCYFVKVAFYVICVFWPKKRSDQEKKAICPVLFTFKQLLFYDYPPKNASKYPKITIFKFTIF